VEWLLCDVIDVDGGPLIHNGSGEAQRSFDSNCRNSTVSSANPSTESPTCPQIPRTRR
jgi:hypothetical protein